MEIIKIQEQELQGCFEAGLAPSLSAAPWSGRSVRAALVVSPSAWFNASNTLPVEVTAPALPLREEGEDCWQWQRLFEERVQDLERAGLSCYQPHGLVFVPKRGVDEALPTTLGIRNMSLQGTITQLKPLLRAASIPERHHVSHFSDYTYVGSLQDPRSLVSVVVGMFSSLGVLQSNNLKAKGRMMSTVNSQGMHFLFFFSTNCGIYCKGLHLPRFPCLPHASFIHHMQVQAMEWPCNGPCRFLSAFYSFLYNMPSGEEAVEAKKAKEC